MYGRGLSPNDINTAITNENLIVLAGTAKIGETEYSIRLNSSPELISAFNDIPVKTVKGILIYLRDVAHVRTDMPCRRISSAEMGGEPC